MSKKVKRAIPCEVMQKEYSRIIVAIVDFIKEEDRVNSRHLELLNLMEDSLDKFAGQAESKIKREQIKSIRLGVVKILRGSTNKLLIASLGGPGN
jgi:hypothetical protein